METSGSNFPNALRAPDLAPVVLADGSFATVELTTEAAVENAAQLSEQRWRALRETLSDSGAPEPVLEAIDPLVPDAHLEGESLTVVANGAGVLLAEHHPDPPARDLGRWAPLPSLIPLLARRQAWPPVVAILCDRRGADLFAFRSDPSDEIRRQAGGGEDPLAKSKPGGWSQRRYQERAENTWEHNARDVAEQVAKLAEQVDARLVVAAGDVRALQLLRESLPKLWLERLRVIEGGRSQDGSLEQVGQDIRPAVADVVDQDRRSLLEKFQEERGQNDRAVEGTRTTLAALAMTQVEVLLVGDDPDDERTAWFGPEPTHVALVREDLVAAGVDAPVEARLLDVAVRATLGTSGAVCVLPPDPLRPDLLAGLLRWSS